MARTPDLARRRELLDALVTECAENGVGGRSLRELADAVGTSHRMLLHHFGSREELLLAVVDDVERRQMALLREQAGGQERSDPGSGSGGQERSDPGSGSGGREFAAMWAHLRSPELRALERLFFECYTRGAQGESPFTTMLPAAVDRWLAEVQAEPGAARLGLAVMRGLLLDLVGTNDDAGVDAAAQYFIDLIEARETGSG